IGFNSHSAWPANMTFAVSPRSFDSMPKRAPSRCANASTSQNPALCRVRRCSAPGLPRPTMSRSPAIEASAPGAARDHARAAPGSGLLLLVLLRRRCRRGGGRLAFRSRRLFGFRAHFLGHDHRMVVLLAEAQFRDLDAFR